MGLSRADKQALLSQSRLNKRGRRHGAVDPAIIKALEKQGKLPKGLSPNKTKAATPKEFAETVRNALIHIEAPEKGLLTLHFEGARLMTLNQLLHTSTYVALSSYKKAWHEKVAEAMFLYPAIPRPFDKKVAIDIIRTAKRSVDDDALPGMFKFLIDGLVKQRVLCDDSKRYCFIDERRQEKGDYAVTIVLRETQETLF